MAARGRSRIALVVPTFPKLSETFIVRHFLGLVDRGWDIHVLCRRFDRIAWKNTPPLALRPQLVERMHTEMPLSPRWRLAASTPRLAATWVQRPAIARRAAAGGVKRLLIDSAVARLEPDLVHFEFGSLAVDRVAAMDRLDIRTVVSFRGFDLNYVGLEKQNHYKPVWQHADALHLLGHDLWRRATRRGCPPSKARALIPPAVNGELFQAKDRGGDSSRGSTTPLRILSVGRLEWKKGHEYSLRALRLLLDTGISAHLEIVGEGAMLDALAFSRHQLGLEKHVTLAGPLSPELVRQRLESADVFLHLAVSEGFCNAVLEAQAMALPVVTSDADGLNENVAHGISGLVVPRRDPDAAAAALRDLAQDSAARRRMGEAGAQRVRREFPPAGEIDSFEKLYRRVLSGKDLEGDLLA